MKQKERPLLDAMEKILKYFHFDTNQMLDTLLDSDKIENGDMLLYVMDRLQTYLHYLNGTENADVSQYLLHAGYLNDEVENFIKEYQRVTIIRPDVKTAAQVNCGDKILEWFKKDTLQFFEDVLNDEDAADDPQYSAVTCEDWMMLYMECKDCPKPFSGSTFLKECGVSESKIELFYEKYRAECIWWYSGEPREPIYANGKLGSYEVEGPYVVGIRDLDERGTIAPRGAEFDADRNCVWTYRLKLLDDGQPDSYLNKTLEELEREYGNVHVWPELEEYGKVPAYVTNRGYLACFLLEGGRVSDIQRIDLCER